MRSKEFETIFRISGKLDGSLMSAIRTAQNALKNMSQTESTGALNRINPLQNRLTELTRLQNMLQRYITMQRELQAGKLGSGQFTGLQEMGRYLKSAGVNLDHLTESMMKLARASADAAAKMKGLGEAGKRLGEARAAHTNASNNVSTSWDNMSNAMTTAQSIMQPLISASETAMNYEAEVSRTRALTQMDNINRGDYAAIEREMTMLDARYKEIGRTTQFSASEAAKAGNYLATAGWTAEEIDQGLKTMVNLAIATNTPIDRTADIFSNFTSSMGIEKTAANLEKLADQTTYLTTHSNQTMTMLDDTMKYVAPVAHMLDVDTADLYAAQKFVADAGIRGSMAGTSMKSLLLRSVAPPKKAMEAMVEAGFMTPEEMNQNAAFQLMLQDEGFDLEHLQDGESMLMALIRQYSEKSKDWDKFKKTSFIEAWAGKYAAPGVMAMMEAGGYEQIHSFYEEMKGSSGAAEQTAGVMADNTRGSWISLQSAIEAASISIGDAFLPMGRSVIETLTGWTRSIAGFAAENPALVQGFGALAATAAGGVMALGGFRLAMAGMNFASTTVELMKATSAFNAMTGTTGIVATTFGKLSTVFSAFSTGGIAAGFGAIGTSIMSAFGALKAFVFTPWGAALAALTAAVYLVYQHWEELAPFFEGLWSQVVGTFTNASAMISPALENMMSAFEQVKAAMIEALGGDEAFSMLLERLSTFGSFLSGALLGAVMIIGQALAGVIGTVVPIVTTLATVITDVISGLVKAVTAFLRGDMAGAIKEFGAMIGNVFKDLGQGIFETLKGAVNMVEGIIDTVKGLWDGSILSGKHDYQRSESVEHKSGAKEMTAREVTVKEDLEVSLKALRTELPAAKTDESMLKAISTYSTAVSQWQKVGTTEQGEQLQATLGTLKMQAAGTGSEEVKAALTRVTASFEKASEMVQKQAALKSDLEKIFTSGKGLYDQRSLSAAQETVKKARVEATTTEEKAATSETLQQFAMTATVNTQTQKEIADYVRASAEALNGEVRREEKVATSESAAEELKATLEQLKERTAEAEGTELVKALQTAVEQAKTVRDESLQTTLSTTLQTALTTLKEQGASSEVLGQLERLAQVQEENAMALKAVSELQTKVEAAQKAEGVTAESEALTVLTAYVQEMKSGAQSSEELARITTAIGNVMQTLNGGDGRDEKIALVLSEALSQMQAATTEQMSAVMQTQETAAMERTLQVEQAQMQVEVLGQSASMSGQNLSVLDAAVQTTATSALPALDAAAAQPTGSLTALGAACDAASGAISGLGSAASAAIAGMQGAAAQIGAAASAAIAQASASAGVKHNAAGGIYPRGEFLTTFAEDSAEAAIPIDGSKKAINLWKRTGELLGILPKVGDKKGASTGSTSIFSQPIGMPIVLPIERPPTFPRGSEKGKSTSTGLTSIFSQPIGMPLVLPIEMTSMVKEQGRLEREVEESDRLESERRTRESAMPTLTLNFTFNGNVNAEEMKAGVREMLPTFEEQLMRYRHEERRRAF